MAGTHKTKSYEEYRERIGNERIPAYEPAIGKEEAALVTKVIERNWLSEGECTRSFESQLAALCKKKHALAFCNATAAMISGMKSFGIGPGDEVIVPSFTHPADPNAVSVIGATPAFAEVNERTLCLSVETIRAALTRKTKAILYVSLYGNVSEIGRIAEFAKSKKLALINDCAAAIFGTYKNKPITSYGDISILSFFADKTITTGEGGMLLTDDSETINESNIYKHDGRKERGHDLIERRGYNFRITELQAAVGLAQLKKAKEFIRRKLQNKALYEKLLKGVPEVRVFQFNPAGKIVPHRVIIFVPEAKPLIDHLTARGIGARSMFMPMHSQPCYGSKQKFSVTENLYRRGVCLPSAPSLTSKNIETVCSAIKKFYQ